MAAVAAAPTADLPSHVTTAITDGVDGIEQDLPPADSPHLLLTPATPEERIAVLKLNSVAWKGPLSVDAYIAREDHLLQQQLTRSRLTVWVLVDRRDPPNQRTIYASCETYKKRALLAFRGCVEDVPTHGIGSVYCRPEFRGTGFAKRMMEELVGRLETWQTGDEKEGRKREVFSVLFSDIGKTFYAQFGWKAFPSSHVALFPIDERMFAQEVRGAHLPATRDLSTVDAHSCMCNEQVAQRQREQLRVASEKSPGAKVAINPDFDHLVWHWAREEFYAERLRPEKGKPSIKGAGNDSVCVYCAWNRNFGETPEENTLFILRWTYDEPTTPAQMQATIEAMAALLRRAQREAHEWNMARVEFWNPAPMMQKAVSLLDPTAEVIHREKDSIASLRWTGAEQGLGDDVEWLWNEKYAWC